MIKIALNICFDRSFSAVIANDLVFMNKKQNIQCVFIHEIYCQPSLKLNKYSKFFDIPTSSGVFIFAVKMDDWRLNVYFSKKNWNWISVVHSNTLYFNISNRHAWHHTIPKAIHITHVDKVDYTLYICNGIIIIILVWFNIYRHQVKSVWFNCRSGIVSEAHTNIHFTQLHIYISDIVYRLRKTMLLCSIHINTSFVFFSTKLEFCVCIVCVRICCRRQNDNDDIDFYFLIHIECWTVRTIRVCLFVCILQHTYVIHTCIHVYVCMSMFPCGLMWFQLPAHQQQNNNTQSRYSVEIVRRS